VSFKVISQEDTKSKYVFLTEKQAKAVIKDLIHMDALEAINTKLQARIDNFLQKEVVLHNIISTKDTIIGNKDKIIAIKDKMLNAKKPFEFHSYGGARTYNLELANPIFYYRAQVEFKSLNVGGMAQFQPVVPNSNVDGFNYSIYVEFKIF
jgi:hypothetical protein